MKSMKSLKSAHRYLTSVFLNNTIVRLRIISGILLKAFRENRDFMKSKIFYTFAILLCFFIFIKATPSLAALAYKIKIKSFYSSEMHEISCVGSKDVCFSTLDFSIDKDGNQRKIDVLVFIEDEKVDIRFKSNGLRLSTASQGWNSFYEHIENFSGEPKLVKLYSPNPAIMDDGRYSVPLVVRPKNTFLTEISINLEAIPAEKK
jgi:hypothetical protein